MATSPPLYGSEQSRFARYLEQRETRYPDPVARELRARLIAGLRGRVLEVGCGDGRNFQHYPSGVTYTIADGQAEDTATVSITVTGSNTAPSCTNVKPSKTKLWPPRHKFILITLSGATDADGDPLTWSITKVTQDEKTAKAISKTDKGPDAQRVAGKPNQVKLKAERVASGNGRVYRIHYTVSDGQGGKCTGVEKVGVPRTKNGTAIDNTAKRYNSFN